MFFQLNELVGIASNLGVELDVAADDDPSHSKAAGRTHDSRDVHTAAHRGQGDNQLAGIMDAAAFLPEGAPAAWSIYFGVTDADTALERIVELGGRVVQPAQDTPYGRLAQAADPTGTLFKLIANP